MQWFRWYHGLCSNPKMGSIARRSGTTRERVIAVWAMVLESASKTEDGGHFRVDADGIADCLNCDTESITKILSVMAALEMVKDSAVVKWEEYQRITDTVRRGRPSEGMWARIRAVIFERDDYTCQYCGERGGRLECDHVLPVSRGGGHGDDNLVTACFRCNRSKRDKTPEEWRATNV